MATTKRVYNGKTYVTHLLRRSIRKGKTVTHETLGNLSHLPGHIIQLVKRSLKGETSVSAAEAFRITRSLPHGHVNAVLTMIRHLRKVWEPLLFEDEGLAEDRLRRDPVRPTCASASARLKKTTHLTSGGLPVQSLRTLLAHLGTRCRNTCVVTGDPQQTTFRQVTEADALQAEALRLIKM